MLATPSPVRVYNNSTRAHWRQNAAAGGGGIRRQRATATSDENSIKIKKLEDEVLMYKTLNKKLVTLASWNLRACHSALKNSQEMLELLQDEGNFSSGVQINDRSDSERE